LKRLIDSTKTDCLMVLVSCTYITSHGFRSLNDVFTGPGTYDTVAKLQPKPITANELKQSAAERYAVLQRKLDDLERIHADGKKSVSTI
jgi:hypothetical protein